MSELKDSKKTPETSSESSRPPEQPEVERSPEEVGQQMVDQGSQAVTDLKRDALDGTEKVATSADTKVDSKTQAGLQEQASQADEAILDMTDEVEEIVETRSTTSRHSAETKADLPENKPYKERRERMALDMVTEIKDLHELTLSVEAESPEQSLEKVRGKLMTILEKLSEFSRQVDPLERENESIYDSLGLRTIEALKDIKQNSSTEISQIFSDIYYEYSEFLDREVIMPLKDTAMREEGKQVNIEHMTQTVYARTPEEVEAIKEKNRESVAQAVKEMSDQPDVTLEMLTELHRINNKGIVPEDISELRKENMVFGKRVGTIGPDVEREVNDVVKRANLLTYRRIFGMSETTHDMAAAKLHNDLLGIHPFNDRNGSTSLLFLELMMARDGRYEPSTERENDYYKQLGKILNGNLLAMGVVLYEQIRTANSYGYYKGATPLDAQRRNLYKKQLEDWKKTRARREAEGKPTIKKAA